jgi:DNA-binding NarL/FixJ family response regulator
LRLILADDSALFRDALAAGLEGRGHEIVGQAADPVGLVAQVADASPDLAIIDIRMPPDFASEGLDAALRIRAEHPRTAVLLLSQYVETSDVASLLGDDPQGVGYLLKDRVADLAELDETIKRIAAGGAVIDPAVVVALLGRRRQEDPLDTLTTREHAVLALMAEGRSNAAIAERLSMNVKTVEGHIAVIFSKLGLEPAGDDHRRVLAVLTFLRA